ncbi:hypothetical protein ONS95_005131 [Cadophora gregata]|uniref:uncharacterized protein n=1 Tax=Cadophora gregata TaxID=51156 RepID=UPI0026DD7AD3|nr:uncharacterized protein ONS95_005131 [Cadophora gregata]KAK0104865.1 hypothetical protein ONS95_005131 [Cadophora gregata]KAK0115056.1 hypothetical protein ONS96_013526 [Cadophora gregata f. sp. sojae]
MLPDSTQTALLMASITASSTLTGVLLSLSYISIPALLSVDLPETHLIDLWRTVYFRGFRLSPPLAVPSGLACLASAMLSSQVDSRSTSYLLTAALLNLSVVPYTILFVSPTNKKLMAKGATLAKKSTEKNIQNTRDDMNSIEETRMLCARWAALNYGRMLLPLGGMVLAWLAL